MARVQIEALRTIREKHRNQKIVFCSGKFDIIHAGHVLFLEHCKKHGDILAVMVAGDNVLAMLKGPEGFVLNEHVRIKIMDSLKPVDYCFIDRTIPKDTNSRFLMLCLPNFSRTLIL